MTTWIAALRSERIKLGRSQIMLLTIIDPVLCAGVGLLSTVDNGEGAWFGLLLVMTLLHAMFFLPMMAGIFSAFVCRYEHAGGGWKQMMSLPVSRSALYLSKLLVVTGALALSQLLFFAAVLGVGLLKGFDLSQVPWNLFAVRMLGGFAACLPLAALQLFVSAMWSSFAAPLVLNMIFTVPNILVANSADFAPYYPWVQPMLVMMQAGGEYDFGGFTLPLLNLMITVGGSFAVFAAAGLAYFGRKPV
ncbi:ABC transporter permease [Saccharibacillus alkalitolerans]|uniref:ABC transporter permease subunit n=1 Tax=Saccharibacillus alkalitolerans TaxID=2705290 RepID=A0ABX0F8Z1_9BACL|nr:ABC transporter permease [Saccharibacillus alkalitolerans]NGZ77342.1 ABC transporter permease subunit [Saccharibacillus alkalitolerans]